MGQQAPHGDRLGDLARRDRDGLGHDVLGPSITANDNSANISAVGAASRLKFYWAVNGSATWHAETVAGKGSVR